MFASDRHDIRFPVGMLDDLRLARRFLVRHWSFSLSAVALLALGIAASTCLFAVVQGALLDPWPYRGADRIVTVRGDYPVLGRTAGAVWSAPEVQDLRDSGIFESVIAGDARNVNLTFAGRAERVRAAVLTPNAFAALGVPAQLGRTLVDADADPGATPVVVVSDAFWRHRLGGDPAILGQTLRVSDAAYTVVGVMPAEFVFWDRDLWTPLRLDLSAPRGNQTLYVQAWLHPDDTVVRAESRLAVLARQFAVNHPDIPSYAGLSLSLDLLEHSVLRDLRPTLYLLLGAAALLLVVAIANLSGAVLAKGASRESEMAIRLAIGASRSRLGRQLLAENLVLGLTGGALGIVAARSLLPHLVAAIPYGYIPAEAQVTLSNRVLVAAAMASIAAGLGIGLMPALRAARAEAGAVLKRAATRSASGTTHRWQRAFLVLQVTLSIVVLAVAMVLGSGVTHLLSRNVGWAPDDVWTARVAMASAAAATRSGATTYAALEDRVRQLPSVTDVALSSALPVGDLPSALVSSDAVNASGRRDLIDADELLVSAQFFDVLGIGLHAGRAFGPSDRDPSHAVSIVTRGLASRLWPARTAIGETLLVDGRITTVVGVTDDVVSQPTAPAARPTVFLPLTSQPPASIVLSVKTRDLSRVASDVRTATASLDPTMPVFGVDMLARVRDDALGPERLAAWLLGLFGAATLVLSVVGIWAAVSQSVAQRRQEIAIRRALGATRGRVLGAEVRRGLAMIAVSVPAAIAITLLAERAIGAALFGFSRPTVVPAIVAAGLVGAAALVATVVPVWRAVSADLILGKG